MACCWKLVGVHWVYAYRLRVLCVRDLRFDLHAGQLSRNTQTLNPKPQTHCRVRRCHSRSAMVPAENHCKSCMSEGQDNFCYVQSKSSKHQCDSRCFNPNVQHAKDNRSNLSPHFWDRPLNLEDRTTPKQNRKDELLSALPPRLRPMARARRAAVFYEDSSS